MLIIIIIDKLYIMYIYISSFKKQAMKNYNVKKYNKKILLFNSI